MADKKLIPVQVVLSMVDGLSYKAIEIGDKIGRITKPVSLVGKSLETLGEVSGFTRLGTQLGKVGTTGKAFLSETAAALTKVAALTAAAGAGVFTLTKGFSQAGDDVDLFSKRLGLSTDAFQEYAYAFKLADVDQEGMVSSLTKLSKGIGEAAAGTGEALVGFNALGISVRGANGHVRSMEELLPEVASKLGTIRNQSVRNAVAIKIFGREGAKLNEVFGQGAEGLKKMREEARRVGAVMTPEQIKLASDFDDGLKGVTTTLLGVRNTIGAALAPSLIDLGKKIQMYVIDHRPEIEAFAKAFGERLPVVIADLGRLFSSLGTVISPVVSLVGYLVDKFGEVSVAAAGLAIWLGGPVIGAFVSFAGAVLGTVVPALTVMWNVGSLLLTVFTGIGGALVALVGWPVVIGAAFVAAAGLIWKYWSPISEFFSNLYDKVRSIFGAQQEIKTSETRTLRLVPDNASMLDAWKPPAPGEAQAPNASRAPETGARALLSGPQPLPFLVPPAAQGEGQATSVGPLQGGAAGQVQQPFLVAPGPGQQPPSLGLAGRGSPAQNRLGPALGAGATADQASRASSSRSENRVMVDFSNVPKGTQVSTKSSGDPSEFDLNLGYGMVGM